MDQASPREEDGLVPTTDKNVQTVLQALASWNEGRMDLELADPAIEVEVELGSVLDGSYRGHHGLTTFLMEFWSQFSSYRTELEECVPAGDDVLLGVRHTGTGRTSGVDVEMPSWQVCTVHSGRVVRWRNFKTRAEAFAAAGLTD